MTKQTPKETQYGRAMLWVFWLMMLGLLTYLFGLFADWRQNPNRSPEAILSDNSRSVVLKSNDRHHYVTAGKINGQKVTFMLDTGATDVAIPESVARRLALEFGPQSIAITANGPVQTHRTRLDTLEIGPIQLHNVRASILPDFADEKILLGMSALKQLKFEQRGDTLRLTQYF